MFSLSPLNSLGNAIYRTPGAPTLADVRTHYFCKKALHYPRISIPFCLAAPPIRVYSWMPVWWYWRLAWLNEWMLPIRIVLPCLILVFSFLSFFLFSRKITWMLRIDPLQSKKYVSSSNWWTAHTAFLSFGFTATWFSLILFLFFPSPPSNVYVSLSINFDCSNLVRFCFECCRASWKLYSNSIWSCNLSLFCALFSLIFVCHLVIPFVPCHGICHSLKFWRSPTGRERQRASERARELMCIWVYMSNDTHTFLHTVRASPDVRVWFQAQIRARW